MDLLGGLEVDVLAAKEWPLSPPDTICLLLGVFLVRDINPTNCIGVVLLIKTCNHDTYCKEANDQGMQFATRNQDVEEFIEFIDLLIKVKDEVDKHKLASLNNPTKPTAKKKTLRKSAVETGETQKIGESTKRTHM